MRPLLLCLFALCLAAAEPPPVPDPFGLGERLALIDLLQQSYRIRPAPEATLEALRSAYAEAWRRAQAAPVATDTIPEEADAVAQAAARARRLRELIVRRHQVVAEAESTEAELGRLLRRLDAERAERDAAAIAALVAGDRGTGSTATPPRAPSPAPAAATSAPAPAAVSAPAGKSRRIAFTAQGVTGCELVEDGGVSALLVAFGSDHNGAFQGLPEAMIAALRGAPGIRRAVLLLGHGSGSSIAGESIEQHLRTNRVFYETLGGTLPAQPVECLVFAACAASNPDQMRSMRDGLGYFPTWRVATAARSYANALTVLAALRATAARPAAPAWRGLFRQPGQDADVGCFGEVGIGGERTEPQFFRIVRTAEGAWKVEEQR